MFYIVFAANITKKNESTKKNEGLFHYLTAMERNRRETKPPFRRRKSSLGLINRCSHCKFSMVGLANQTKRGSAGWGNDS